MSENRFFIDTIAGIKKLAASTSTQQDVLGLFDRFRDIQLNYSLLKSCFSTLHQQHSVKEEQLNELVSLLLDHAIALKKLHVDYLSSPQYAPALEKEICCYRKFLKDQKVDLPTRLSPIRKMDIPGTIRSTTTHINWPRLFVVRVKRVLDVTSMLAHNARALRHFTEALNNVSAPIFAWLAWLFYLPRLVTNLMILAAHFWPGFGMSEEERTLGWQLRLKIQLQDLWFELANDLVWAAVGLINCFILVGALTPAAAYLTVALYSFDVMLACIRAYVELERLKQYQLELEKDEALPEPVKNIMLERFAAHYQYECLRLGLSVITTASLLAAMSLTIPVLASITAIIPLVGVSLVVAVCLISFGLGKYIEKYKLNDALPDDFIQQSYPQTPSAP